MQVVKNVLSVAMAALTLVACNSVDFKKTKSGVPYKIFPAKSGEKIVAGNFVKFNFLFKTKDTTINSSYGKTPGYQPVSVDTAKGYDIGIAINEILLKSKKGDSIYISFSADSLIAKNPMIVQQLPLKKGDNLIFTIKVLDVFKTGELAQADFMKEEQVFAQRMQKEQEEKFKTDPKILEQMKKDSKLIEDYLTANHITAQKLGLGTYVEVIKPGTDPKITKGKFVTMYYTGSTLGGKQFETNFGKEPATFQLEGKTIKGFEEGLIGLGKGAKAKIFIPSMLGYGPQPRSEIIGAYENLIFDVEIVDVTDTPPAPKNIPQQNIDTTRGR